MSLDPPCYGPWHFWFAWHPVRTHYYGWRWLRTVERCRWFGGRSWSGWDYQPTRDDKRLPTRKDAPMKIPPEMVARAARAMWMEFHRDEDHAWAAAAWDDMGGSEPSDERANYEYIAASVLAAMFKDAEVEAKDAAVHPFAAKRGWPDKPARKGYATEENT